MYHSLHKANYLYKNNTKPIPYLRTGVAHVPHDRYTSFSRPQKAGTDNFPWWNRPPFPFRISSKESTHTKQMSEPQKPGLDKAIMYGMVFITCVRNNYDHNSTIRNFPIVPLYMHKRNCEETVKKIIVLTILQY